MNKVRVLISGYSEMLQNDPEVMRANCTCTLIQSGNGENIIIDTMDAWSGTPLLEALKGQNVSPDEINYCISTHTHPDHMGNNNLFLKARHIVGHTISEGDKYFSHDFMKEPYVINDDIKIVSTKGHTLTCVSVICKNTYLDGKTVAIVGDLFEHGDDIDQPELWRDAGSEAIEDQLVNRHKIATEADYIVPGHGPIFDVSRQMREKLYKQLRTKKT